MAIDLRNRQAYFALANAYDAAVTEVPGTEGCLHCAAQTFEVPSRHACEQGRVYRLTPLQAALLLEHGRLPEPANVRYRQECRTEGCVAGEHYVLLRTRPGAPGCSSKRPRIEDATCPEDFFPPRWFQPLAERGLRCTGAHNPNTRIPAETVGHILRLRYCEGLLYRVISERTGVALRTVTGMCNGNTRRDIAQRLMPELIAGARKNGLLPPEEPGREPPRRGSAAAR